MFLKNSAMHFSFLILSFNSKKFIVTLKNDPCRPAWPEMNDWRGLAEVVNLIESLYFLNRRSTQFIF